MYLTKVAINVFSLSWIMKMGRTLCEPVSVEATSANNCVPLKISLQSCGKTSNFDKRAIVSITLVIFSKKLYTNYISNTYIIDP